jgi:Tfp pilus assembly protein PilF
LDLCFAHLELRRFADAWRHGHRALALGPTAGGDTEKNALYLLGEVANLAGDDQRAQDYFSRLQRFYPDAPFLTDFLLAIDVRKVINLKA